MHDYYFILEPILYLLQAAIVSISLSLFFRKRFKDSEDHIISIDQNLYALREKLDDIENDIHYLRGDIEEREEFIKQFNKEMWNNFHYDTKLRSYEYGKNFTFSPVSNEIEVQPKKRRPGRPPQKTKLE